MPKPFSVKIEPVYDFHPNPQTDVTHFNHVRFTQVGTDVYMDVGVVPAEQLLAAAEQQSEIPNAEFRVLRRFACSVNTLAALRRTLGEIWDRLQKNPQFLDADLTDRGNK